MKFNQEKLYIPELGVYRLWNIPSAKGVREGEGLSREIPLEANSIMALALVKAYRLTGGKHYLDLAAGILSAFQELEPQMFEEDPNDAGKLFFGSYVFFLNALDAFVEARSNPTA